MADFTLPDKFDLKVSGTVPGETLVVAAINAASAKRDTMSVENRNEWDRIELILAKGWINWWAARGIGEKV